MARIPPKKLNEVRATVLAMVKKEPNKPMAYFGRKCVELGLLTNERSIYSIVKKSNYLQTEISEIQKKNWEKLTKDITPLALREHEAGLKETIPSEIPCNLQRNGEIMKASVCKKCKDRFKCEDYKGYRKEIRRLKKDKFPLIKLAEDVEFKVEEARRPTTPALVEIDQLTFIQQHIAANIGVLGPDSEKIANEDIINVTPEEEEEDN